MTSQTIDISTLSPEVQAMVEGMPEDQKLALVMALQAQSEYVKTELKASFKAESKAESERTAEEKREAGLRPYTTLAEANRLMVGVLLNRQGDVPGILEDLTKLANDGKLSTLAVQGNVKTSVTRCDGKLTASAVAYTKPKGGSVQAAKITAKTSAAAIQEVTIGGTKYRGKERSAGLASNALVGKMIGSGMAELADMPSDIGWDVRLNKYLILAWEKASKATKEKLADVQIVHIGESTSYNLNERFQYLLDNHNKLNGQVENSGLTSN